jgi:hypothetical protein
VAIDNPPRRRGNLVFVVGVALVLAVVGVGYVLILRRTEAPAPVPPEPPKAQVPAAQLTRADGAVQLRFGAGDWQDARVGAPVAPGTDLRTGEGGSAALSLAGAIEIEVASDGDFRLEELDENVAKITVREGLVVADVKPESGRVLRVAAVGSDAVTETTDGRVHVLTDGKGTVEAAVIRGSATVAAHGEKIALAQGYATTVTPGSGPTTPTPMPKSLLLKVKWPPESTTAKRRQFVAGTTNPGARVRIGNTVAIADAKGRFGAVIELQEGSNEIRAYAMDVFGRIEKTRSPAVELDTKAPYQEIKTDPDMWKNQPLK